jgi:hypothetical protein
MATVRRVSQYKRLIRAAVPILLGSPTLFRPLVFASRKGRSVSHVLERLFWWDTFAKTTLIGVAT